MIYDFYLIMILPKSGSLEKKQQVQNPVPFCVKASVYVTFLTLFKVFQIYIRQNQLVKLKS